MSKVCSSHNLIVLEEINAEFKKSTLHFKLILNAFEDEEIFSKYKGELVNFLCDHLQTLENLSHSFLLWEKCLGAECNMNENSN